MNFRSILWWGCGYVSKSEGETAVFKNGDFDSIITTPLGNIAVAICYDAKHKHFYNNIRDEKISMILFPHGCPADPNKPKEEEKINDHFCGCYKKAFNVPVVYVNSVGSLEYMPGTMGKLMAKAGFRMNGKSKIYADGKIIETSIPEAIGMEVSLTQNSLRHEIRFYKDDIINGNWLFRKFILEPDKKKGLKMYKKDKTHYIKSKIE